MKQSDPNSNYHTIIEKAKTNLKVVVMDYDGTVFDGSNKYDHQAAARLFIQIIDKRKIPVVISARDASFKRYVLPLISSKLSKFGGNGCLFFSGGNGAYLVKVSPNEELTYYNHNLDYSDFTLILRLYDEASKQLLLNKGDLIQTGIKTFSDFLITRDEWERYIPGPLIDLSVNYGGAIFIELSKISMVLPNNIVKQQKLISYLVDNLPKSFNVSGDNSFIHVSNKIENGGKLIDGKLNAVTTIINLLGLSKEEICAFGDSPSGNDGEMLRFLPYSFTNDKKYKSVYDLSPYYIPGISSPVEKVHITIQYLID